MRWNATWRSDEELALPDTGLFCPMTGERIHFSDEVFLLQVTQPALQDGALIYIPLCDDEGDYLYQPYIFSFSGWENIEEDLQNFFEDEPPKQDPEGILECDICGSDICAGETTGVVQFGEIQVSRRQPDNEQIAAAFESMGDDVHLCVGCLMWLDTKIDNFDAWSLTAEELEREIPIVQPFKNSEICRFGIETCCWRWGYSCECKEEYER